MYQQHCTKGETKTCYYYCDAYCIFLSKITHNRRCMQNLINNLIIVNPAVHKCCFKRDSENFNIKAQSCVWDNIWQLKSLWKWWSVLFTSYQKFFSFLRYLNFCPYVSVNSIFKGHLVHFRDPVSKLFTVKKFLIFLPKKIHSKKISCIFSKKCFSCILGNGTF